ncbi:MAG: Fic family protein [Holosporales bacterium]|jgi:Fic family protein|nr:Fic family protein [Holosporales bacterium]
MDSMIFPEVFISTAENKRQVYSLMKAGKLRKLSSKLYTPNIVDDAEKIVNRNLWRIVGLLYPNALISDRTALELKPTPHPNGTVFIISDKTRPTTICNTIIKPRKGHPPIEGDNRFMDHLFLMSSERAMLENARATRTPQGEVPRNLSDVELEEYLDGHLTKYGTNAVNKMRDRMKDIARQIGLDKEFEKINGMIGSLLSTHDIKLKSTAGVARQSGYPFDVKRVELFHKLYREILNLAQNIRYNTQTKLDALYFYEAYFSNFIEGTEFAVEEARNIVFENYIPPARPQDAHDVLGTFKVVSNGDAMAVRYRNFEHFVDVLRARHATIMDSRKDKMPGEFKHIKNQAGSTVFVNPENVVGTLRQGFDLYSKIDTAFGRAVFMMFLISEVHPFNDGNGRVGRIMMNGELVARGEQRIIIPTVYRNNYLSALRALSNSGYAEALIRMLDFAQKYTNAIDWSNFQDATDLLAQTNAFMNPNEADENGRRLRFPSEIA